MPRVLIVEDEFFVALDIENILLASGFSVSGIAADRKAALALAGESDVALIDINLHDGPTGPSIGTELAERHGVKIVFVTANPEQIGAAQKVAAAVINKPFRSETIVKMVQSVAREAVRFRTGHDDMAAFMPAYQAASSRPES